MDVKSLIESEIDRLEKDQRELLNDFSSFLELYAKYIFTHEITIDERKIMIDYMSELINIQSQIKMINNIKTTIEKEESNK